MIRAISARTTFRNTVETDAMPEVYHSVSWSSDSASGTVYIKAEDPTDAIRKVNNMTEEELSLYSVKPSSN